MIQSNKELVFITVTSCHEICLALTEVNVKFTSQTWKTGRQTAMVYAGIPCHLAPTSGEEQACEWMFSILTCLRHLFCVFYRHTAFLLSYLQDNILSLTWDQRSLLDSGDQYLLPKPIKDQHGPKHTAPV